MRVVKCESNHFYDADKYEVCPQCGAAMGASFAQPAQKASQNTAAANSAPQKASIRETFGVFKKDPFRAQKKRMESVNNSTANHANLTGINTDVKTNANNEIQMLNPNSLLAKPQPEPKAFASEPELDMMPEEITEDSFAEDNEAAPEVKPELESVEMIEDLFESVPEEETEATPEVPQEPEPESAPESVPVSVEIEETVPAEESEASSVVESEEEVEEPEEEQEDSLLNEIKKVSSDNEGKTVGFFSSGRSSGQNVSDNVEQGSHIVPSEEPVVGWLVCIGGPNIGQSFCIHAGKNSLGRSRNNMIVIDKDRTVSREKHAWIIYEPRKGEFYAQPGESSGLTYVDDENIMQATRLTKWSCIDVGDTRLTLVPLCDSEFSWENYL